MSPLLDYQNEVEPSGYWVQSNEQLSFLRCVHQHLEPGGRLVFDAFNPNLALLAAAINPDEIEDTPELSLPDGRRLRRAFRVLQKRHAEQGRVATGVAEA